MEFRTELNKFTFPFQIKLSDPLFFIGSCFSDNMGKRFSKLKFSVTQNPFGTLYNPISLSNSLIDILSKKEYASDDIVESQGIFYSWSHHGSIAELSEEKLIKKINNLNAKNHNQLVNSKFLFITLGSAWAYQIKENNRLVANCHKVTSKNFNKTLIPSEEIVKSISETIALLKKLNPNVEVVLSVSPVRHIRDGLVENNRSKAELITAVHQICKLPNCSYLPAYEWVADDLRDYRFFEKDMVHPNLLAQDYIWEKILNGGFSRSTQEQIGRIQKFTSGFSHKPFNSEDPNHISFLKNLLIQGDRLQSELNIDLKEELSNIKKQISTDL